MATNLDFTTGRILLLDADHIAALTPAKFYEYVDEGFIPMGEVVSSGTVTHSFISYTTEENGADYTITLGNTSYTSDDLDTVYAAN